MIFRLVVCLAVLSGLTTPAPSQVLLSEAEIVQTLRHGPWPPAQMSDPSNRVSGQAAAIAFGKALFSDPILSVDQTMSCASCHDPQRAFSEPRARAQGRVILDRNTPSLMNVAFHRWFGWAGDTDNLWAQSLTPIINDQEMAHSAESLARALAVSPLQAQYDTVFGPADRDDAEQVLVNIAKALAAYQEQLVTAPTAFDRFRDALAAEDLEGAASYPQAAQRGLQLFLGRGNCSFCHSGPSFTNGEFHDAGRPYFVTPTRVDPGRHGGLLALLESPYSLAGMFSDDPDRTGAWAVEQVTPLHSDFGTFRVPGLRGAAKTAPYMHDGSVPDLRSVIAHYNEIDLERMHADGEAILAPLGLTPDEIADLVAFLESLS